MNYLVASTHSPDHDRAIRWDSFGFDWGIKTPVMSQRDKDAIELKQFNSPFK
jgi:dTDP-4-dehydrorhamnose 3,5-epimerase-like enzyme